MRIRNIKPSFFKNEKLAEIPHVTQLLFIGLWCLADREGRLEFKPKKIRAELFPYGFETSPIPVSDITEQVVILEQNGFVRRYKVAENEYIYIPKFIKHQYISKREPASELPEFKEEYTKSYTGSRPVLYQSDGQQTTDNRQQTGDNGQQTHDNGEKIPATFEAKVTERSKKPKLTNPEIALFINYFCDKHEEKFGCKTLVSGGKDGTGVKRALGTYRLDELKKMTDNFFDDSNVFPKGDHSLSNFLNARTLERYLNKRDTRGGNEHDQYKFTN